MNASRFLSKAIRECPHAAGICRGCIENALDAYHLHRLRLALGHQPVPPGWEEDIYPRRAGIFDAAWEDLDSEERDMRTLILLVRHYRDLAAHIATDTGHAGAYERGLREGLAEMKRRCVGAAGGPIDNWRGLYEDETLRAYGLVLEAVEAVSAEP